MSASVTPIRATATPPDAAKSLLADVLADPTAVGRLPAESLPALVEVVVQEWVRIDMVKLALVARVAAAGGIEAAQTIPMPPYALADLVRLLGKSRPWVRRQAKLGRIKGARKVGKSWVFNRPDIDRLLRQAHDIA